MSLPVMNPPNIQLLIQGITVLSIEEAAKSCQLGIVNLAHTEGHGMIITVVKATFDSAQGPSYELLAVMDRNTIKGDMTLDLRGSAGGSGIAFYRGSSFSRLGTGNDPHDFRWVLNVQDEIYLKEHLNISKDFRSIIKINNINDATFYVPSNGVSTNQLNKTVQGQTSTVGPVAVKIGANFPLSADASFFNGTEELPLPKPNTNDVTYLISVAQSRPGMPMMGVNDTRLYERVIDGSGTSLGSISFSAQSMPAMVPHMFSPPDAACFPPSVTQPLN